jgi:hypothetical protein
VVFSAPVLGTFDTKERNDVTHGGSLGKYKISITGKLVRYGVEISQPALNVMSFQWRESKSWLKRHGAK